MGGLFTMGKKLTHNDFLKRVKKLTGDEYMVVGEYQGADAKMVMKHFSCGNEYLVTPYKFSSGRRCPKCAGNQKKTHEQFKIEFDVVFKGEYDLIGTYKGARNKVKIIHNKCGHNYEATPDGLLNKKSKCPACNEKALRLSRIKSPETFEKEFNQLCNGDYKLLSKYKRDHLKIKVKHLNCGEIYEVEASSFIQGTRCKSCQAKKVHLNQTWTQRDFEEKIAGLGFGKYELLSQYTLSVNKVKLRHLMCGSEYEVTPGQFIQGSRCPRCQSSKGEMKVELYLRENKYEFKPQYRFGDCRYKRPLPFDFAILKDDEITCLIEYQGRQHFTPIEVFGGKKGYETTKIRDRIKETYCKENNIPLIEIPYTIKDVNSFLDEKLLKHYANPDPSTLEMV